jgi:hypothetical protein
MPGPGSCDPAGAFARRAKHGEIQRSSANLLYGPGPAQPNRGAGLHPAPAPPPDRSRRYRPPGRRPHLITGSPPGTRPPRHIRAYRYGCDNLHPSVCRLSHPYAENAACEPRGLPRRGRLGRLVASGGGVRRWRQAVASGGGVRRWRQAVASGGGVRRWRQAVASASSSAKPRVLLGSTGIPGPMVVVKVTFRRYLPLAAAGLSRITSSRAAA